MTVEAAFSAVVVDMSVDGRLYSVGVPYHIAIQRVSAVRFTAKRIGSRHI